MTDPNTQPLDQQQVSILLDRITGFAMILTDAMKHINVCLYMDHWDNYENLDQDELNEIYFSHYKLAVIDAAKLISFKKSKDLKPLRVKAGNDLHAIYSIFNVVDNFKPNNISNRLRAEMAKLKKELEEWDDFSQQVMDLRNEWFAHLGPVSRRSKIEFVGADFLNNYLVLLNEFIKLLNIEFKLGLNDLMDEDHTKIVRIYRKGFRGNDNPFILY